MTVDSGLYYTTTSWTTRARREPLPLDGVHVAVRIVNLVAEVQVVQFYVNSTNTNIDCVYEFPMDDSAAVCGLEVEMKDRLLVGEVREQSEARAEYSRAISQGQTAALVEEDKPDIFRQTIGNVPPQSRVNVRITYVTELKIDKETGGAIFVLPTSVAPRYNPYNNNNPIPFGTRWQDVCFGRRLSYSSPGGSVKDLPFSKWSYEVPTFIVTRERPTAFSLTLEVEMPSKVLSVESRTHRLRTEKPAPFSCPNVAAASLFKEHEAMGKDLEVIIYQEKPFEPCVQLEVLPDGSGCAMMTFVPEFETEAGQMEIVFVVDCSGSMSGVRIEAAKRALGILVQSLPLSCTFNIIRFGGNFELLFDQPRPYSQVTLSDAKIFIQSMKANMGGTEILGPLQRIVKSSVTIGGSRQVFVLTDGFVSNTEEVIHLLRMNAFNTRVFTVGIGDEVSRHLVEGMARASSGTAEFILGKDLSGEDTGVLDSKLINQLKLATLPSITKIDVDWLGGTRQIEVPMVEGPTSKFFPTGPNGKHPGSMTRTTGQSYVTNVLAHQVGSGQWLGNAVPDASFAQPQGRNRSLYQAPFLPPPLFSGHKYIMYCFFRPEEMANVSQVNVSGLVPGGGDLFLAVPITKVTSVGRTVHLLGARALIRDLSEGTSHLHFQKSFASMTGRPNSSFTYSSFSGWLSATRGTGPQDRATAWDLVPINPPNEIVSREIIEMGTRFGIVSKETSFVAVEWWSDGRTGIAIQPKSLPFEANGRTGIANPFPFEAHLVQLQSSAYLSAPSAATTSFFDGALSQMRSFFGGTSESSKSFGSAQKPSSARNYNHPASPPIHETYKGIGGLSTTQSRAPLQIFYNRDSSYFENRDEEIESVICKQVESKAVVRASLHTVVMMQNFDGSIDVNESNAKTLGWSTVRAILSLDTYKVIQNVIQNETLASKLFFTVVFLAVLMQRFQSDADKWSLVASKTGSWLTTTLMNNNNLSSRSEANQLMESWLTKTRKLCA